MVTVVSDERTRFDALFAEHYADLLRFAVRRVGADDAPDVVGEVFLAAEPVLADDGPNEPVL